MNAVNAVSEADREYIRSRFSQGIDAGAVKAQLDDIRKELRAKYCPHQYTEAQVGAVCSQVIIQRARLSRSGITTVLASSQAEGETTASPAPEKPVLKESVPELSATSEVTVHGERYRNETKERWFREWLDGIVGATTPEWRAEAYVLTLAGPLCLRLPDYIAAGFTRERIVAVEGGSDAEKKLFEQNCPPGVLKRLQRLEDFIATDTTPYGVIEADFVGPVQDKYLEIISNMPTAKRAFVIINVMGKRETNASQEILQTVQDDVATNRRLKMYHEMQKKMIEAGRVTDKERTTRVVEKSAAAGERILAGAGETELSEARMNALSCTFTRVLGSNRIDLSPFKPTLEKMIAGLHQRMGGEATITDLTDDIFLIMVGFCQLLNNHMRQHRLHGIPWPKDLSATLGLTVRGLLNRSLIKTLRKVKYQSEKHGTPYYSVIMETESPDELLSLCPDVLAFTTHLTEKMSTATTKHQVEDGTLPYALVNHLLNPLTMGLRRGGKAQPIGAGDTLAFSIDGFRTGKIQAGTFFRQIDAYERNIWTRWPMSDDKKHADVPWEDITVRKK